MSALDQVGTVQSPAVPPRRLRAARRWTYRQLEPSARAKGLSPFNLVSCGLIILASTAAILETEPSISHGRGVIFRALELGFGVCFAIEYLARLWVAGEDPRYGEGFRGRLKYLLTAGALVDLIAIAPSLFMLTSAPTYVLRLLRAVRVLRLARLGRLTTAWRLLSDTLSERKFELGLTAVAALLTLIFSAVALYMIEGQVQPVTFGSVPRALWWGVVTLTTIGYGDVYPVTPLGKAIATLTAFAGIGLIATPTGIMAAGFSDALKRHREALPASDNAGVEGPNLARK